MNKKDEMIGPNGERLVPIPAAFWNTPEGVRAFCRATGASGRLEAEMMEKIKQGGE